MSKDYGLYDHRTLLIAHLLRECGSMTEFCGWSPGKASNDHGWAFGIAQWHLAYREAPWLKSRGFTTRSNISKVREAYFADHPDMKDWRNQAKRYLREIQAATERLGSVEAAVDSWNANPSYMTHVRQNVAQAKQLLSL